MELQTSTKSLAINTTANNKKVLFRKKGAIKRIQRTLSYKLSLVKS